MHSPSQTQPHTHAAPAQKPPRPNPLVNFVLAHVHDTELWANYLPGVPVWSYLLAILGAALVIAGAIFWSSQVVWAVLSFVVGLLLLVPLIGLARFVRWKRRISFSQRNRMLDSIKWRGDEHLLDVGCGNGLILNGAAQRLPAGRAVGIDLWVEHGGGGDYALLQKNAHLEKVADRIEFKQADARHLPFNDASFDAVMSSGAIHHMIHSREDFEAVLSEMMRVLKPGGAIVISDITHLIDASTLRLTAAGLTCESRPIEPFLHYDRALVVARKPA